MKASPSPSIITETPDFVVFNKPAGLDSQNSRKDRDSLVDWIERRFHFPGLVHRLDFGVSGVMIAAKNARTAKEITDALQAGHIKRIYRAIVLGQMDDENGVIDKPIDGKNARTSYEVLDRYANATDLRVILDTGRKHQIRKHFFMGGHPILGDHLYKKKGSDLLMGRPALHSWILRWNDKIYESPLPDDIEKLLQRLRKSQADFNA